MDNLVQLLFNPNHEMPNGYVMAALVAIALLTSVLTNYFRDRHESRKHDSGSASSDSDKKKRKKR